MLWVPSEPRWDFMCPAVRKSLRTPDWRHKRQEKRKAMVAVVVVVVGGGGGVLVSEEDGTLVLM
jgi:hypothetical protein